MSVRTCLSRESLTNELTRSQTNWKSKSEEELQVLQEQYMTELKVWQQEFYDHLVDDGTLNASTDFEAWKHKLKEHEIVIKAKAFLKGIRYTVIDLAPLNA